MHYKTNGVSWYSTQDEITEVKKEELQGLLLHEMTPNSPTETIPQIGNNLNDPRATELREGM